MVLNDPIVWTNSGSIEGWDNAGPIGTGVADLDNPDGDGAGGLNDGYLRISFTNIFETVPSPEEDTIYLSQGAGGTNFDNVGNVGFSFLVSNEAPLSAYVSWHSTNMASTDRWEYAFSPTLTNSWESFVIPFTGGGGWNQPGGRDFFEDLAYVDWIGINISRMQDTGPYVYGLDNWEYLSSAIPEPGSWCLIATALAAVALARRRTDANAERKPPT